MQQHNFTVIPAVESTGLPGDPFHARHLINGSWRDSADGAIFERRSPSSDVLVTRVARGSDIDTSLAIAAARVAFDDGRWSQLSGRQRSSLLLRVADLIERERERIAQVNEACFGLSAGVWSENVHTCLDFARRVQAGTGWTNTWSSRACRCGSAARAHPGFRNAEHRQGWSPAKLQTIINRLEEKTMCARFGKIMFGKTMFGKTVAAMAVLAASTGVVHAGDVEVLHWWTSGGEATALNVLKDDLKSQDIGWEDMPVAGGGGTQAMTVLRARVTSGNPPTAVQMLGFDITDWAKEGALADLNDIAAAEKWNEVVPEALQKFSTYDGRWVATPVNVHSTNWVWANKPMLDELGIAQPTSWDELVAAMEKVKAAGRTAVAHGGQAWQDATIFDAVAMATGGPDFYQAAFIDLDPAVLGSDTMKAAFDRMSVIRSFVDDNFSGRDWNLASAMVINGEAAFQFMGDWAKGEFLNAGKKPGEDFLCFRFPGTQDQVIFNADQFALFREGDVVSSDQAALAKAILSPTFQSAFNVIKGSVPARTDVSDAAFDACGKQGIKDLSAASASGNLFGSMAHGHANPASVKNAIYDVVTAHFNGEYDSATAIEELVTAVEISQ